MGGCVECSGAAPQRFISHDDFKKQAAEKKWVILDCSQDVKDGAKAADTFKNQHVDNAHFFDTNAWKELPTQADLVKALEGLKVGTESNVVCYDNANGINANKVAALLSTVGVKSVQVLDFDFATLYKKVDKEIAKSADNTGAEKNWNKDLDAAVFTAKEMEDYQAGKKAVTMLDMRTADEQKKGEFTKKGDKKTSIGVEKVYAKHKSVAAADVEKVLAAEKLQTTDKIVIVGGGENAWTMANVLCGHKFNNVQVYQVSFDNHIKKHPLPAEKPKEEKPKEEKPKEETKDAPAKTENDTNKGGQAPAQQQQPAQKTE